MLQTLKNAWKLVDLRKKILFTLLIIVIFRIGSHIPVPFVDVDALSNSATTGGDFFSYLNILTGGAMNYGALFAMSVTPYINASIIIQLLGVAIPALDRLRKEGEEGQKKLSTITRIVAMAIALLQGFGYFMMLSNAGYLNIGSSWFDLIFAGIVIIACFTAGSALIMWLGEQIDNRGVGNGISIILFAGILSRAPQAFAALWSYFFDYHMYIPVIAIILVFFAVIVFIVFMTDGERRIPVQYAKRVVGRKMYGGQSSHIPIKVNMSGVMPIIFASSILALPSTILSFMSNTESTMYRLLSVMGYRSVFYAIVYLLLIIGFAYFYVQIQYNPMEMANNLRKNNGAIPGYRPGKPTSDFIAKILSKITLVGALFLGVIAVLPIIIGSVGGINVSLGGTSILIVVGVALDTVNQLESQMLMRHYKGFLD